MLKSPKKADLSVIILNYNTKEVTKNCLASIDSLKTKLNLQIILVDNASTDGSVEMLENFQFSNNKTWQASNFQTIRNKKNLGFSKGNNSGRKYVNSDTVLFLNSDTLVHENSFDLPFDYLQSDEEVGAITVKTILPNGEYDTDMRRRFPTPLISLARFTGFSSPYSYAEVSPETLHEIDVAQGAYLMVKKRVLDQVGWFDEDYFLDGEDIDLCWKIKEAGYKIIYFPDSYITHIKKASKNADRKRSLASVTRGVEAMRIFYKKHLEKRYPFLINQAVYLGINSLKLARILKHKLTV